MDIPCVRRILTKCVGNADAAVIDKHLESRHMFGTVFGCVFFFSFGVFLAIVCALVCPRIINTLTTFYTVWTAHHIFGTLIMFI